MTRTGLALLFLVHAWTGVFAAQAPSFKPPSSSPESTSMTYIGANNGTLTNGPVVPGKVFDRFIQIWLENTDFNTAASSKTFQTLAKQGITLEQYYAVTHPSEPNYVAAVGGDFFGMHDDALYNIPTNVSTIVDLLEAKNISWASYQESMPTDGYQGFNFSSPNYIDSSAPPYTYYVRKHNPLVIYDSVATVSSRLARHRNFNDFAADLNASALPQWIFITPNMVNDGHDTDIDFASNWLEFWLVPLLKDEKFNDGKTLILLTFDENETFSVNNRLFTILLGGVLSSSQINTTDSTYYTHYSSLSTVQANWGLGSLGRHDTNTTFNNVFKLVADVTGWKNNNLTDPNTFPLTNLTGSIPGPLNAQLFTKWPAPNPNATGAGGGPVFIAPGNDLSQTPDSLGAPTNLTAGGNSSAVVPAEGPLVTETSPAGGSGSSGGSGGGTNGGVGMMKVGLMSLVVGIATGMGMVLY